MNWTVKHIEDEGIELIDPTDGKVCATIVGCTPEALSLIEAAPDLLKALYAFRNALKKKVVKDFLNNEEDAALYEAYIQAGAAIAKSEGH